jgi:hypothetical protein
MHLIAQYPNIQANRAAESLLGQHVTIALVSRHREAKASALQQSTGPRLLIRHKPTQNAGIWARLGQTSALCLASSIRPSLKLAEGVLLTSSLSGLKPCHCC